LVALLAWAPSRAVGAVFRAELEPVVGYERVEKLVPTAHTRDRLVYGGRLTLGVIWVAVEAEYLTSNDVENFVAEGLSTKDVTERAKAGLRFSMNLARVLAFTLRGGAQASRNRHTETLAGITLTTLEPLTYRPYLGAGLTATLARNLAFRADVTTVFKDFPSLLGAEYQLTAGFVIRFP
jgi:hypothetical protein